MKAGSVALLLADRLPCLQGVLAEHAGHRSTIPVLAWRSACSADDDPTRTRSHVDGATIGDLILIDRKWPSFTPQDTSDLI